MQVIGMMCVYVCIFLYATVYMIWIVPGKGCSLLQWLSIIKVIWRKGKRRTATNVFFEQQAEERFFSSYELYHTSVLHDPYVGSRTQLRVLESTSQLGMSEPSRGCPAVEQTWYFSEMKNLSLNT